MLVSFLHRVQILQRLSALLSVSQAHLEILSMASSPRCLACLLSSIIAYYSLLNKNPWTDSLPPYKTQQ